MLLRWQSEYVLGLPPLELNLRNLLHMGKKKAKKMLKLSMEAMMRLQKRSRHFHLKFPGFPHNAEREKLPKKAADTTKEPKAPLPSGRRGAGTHNNRFTLFSERSLRSNIEGTKATISLKMDQNETGEWLPFPPCIFSSPLSITLLANYKRWKGVFT